MPGAVGAGGRALPVVGHPQLQRVGQVAQRTEAVAPGPPCLRVLVSDSCTIR